MAEPTPTAASPVPAAAAGVAASADWTERALAAIGPVDAPARQRARAAIEWAGARRPSPGGPDDAGLSVPELALEAARILAAVGTDPDSRIAALVAWGPLPEEAARTALRAAAGADVAGLVEGVARLEVIQSVSEAGEAGTTPAQQEALRKMLLAMVQDIRTVVVKLAQVLALLRALTRHPDPALEARQARVTLDLFAPLANRLGVWQLKWELEDLAFRFAEPDTYRRIARLLDEKRADRESLVAEVMQALRDELAAAGIDAQVSGRPKHIYSIYRKMGRKGVDFGDLHDVFGVRVLVPEVRDCYTVLGLVHHRWTPIPREFDDYIAKPKGNDYRSLHTAVIGPRGRAVEVQIRTHEMHRHAELGVAAHWAYKEGAARAGGDYDQRIGWLRGLLDWRDTLAGEAEGSLAQRFRTGLFDDVVYALTPQGRVVDLPTGSTPVDFAYALHTELGHRCRGARVDGAIVPLTFPLANGQTVEIIAAKEGGPSRDWLNPALGFARSSRARNKVRQWFNAQNLAASIAQGRAVVERELQRLGMTAFNLDLLAPRLGHARLDEALAAIARGDVNQRQLQAALRESDEPTAPVDEDTLPLSRPARGDGSARGVLVVGVDKLLTALARCCKPAPPDAIVGFVSRGRGVTVHRRDCPNVSRLPAERLIESAWGAGEGGRYPVDLEVVASDRQGLLRDISEVLAREKVNVTATQTATRADTARMRFTVEVLDVAQIRRLLAMIDEVPGVASVRRN